MLLPYRNLIQDLASGRQRLDEHGSFIWNRIRHYMQIAFGQRQKLLKGAGMLHDTEHRPGRAMTPQAAGAPRTVPAIQIDLANNSFADKRLRIRIHDFTHKFMTWRARETVIPTL